MKLEFKKITVSRITNLSAIKGGVDNTQGQTKPKKEICLKGSDVIIVVEE